MKSWLYSALRWMKWSIGIFPKGATGSKTAFYIVHAIFVVIGITLLCVFNQSILSSVGLEGVGENLKLLKDYWLGILGALIYVIGRLVFYLISLFGLEVESEYPEIEKDWQDILIRLENLKIDISERPLFLVNGFTPHQLREVFEGALQSIVIESIPKPSYEGRDRAKIRMYLTDDELFLAILDVSATNQQQSQIKGTDQLTSPADAQKPRRNALARGLAKLKTFTPNAAQRARSDNWETPDPRKVGHGKNRLQPISDDQRDVGKRQLHFLCELIDRDRYPYEGINGMLQGVPISWTEQDEDLQDLALSPRDDLKTVHKALNLRFPVIAAITELDALDGLTKFVLRGRQHSSGMDQGRAGVGVASVLDVIDEDRGHSIDINQKNLMMLLDASFQWFRTWNLAIMGDSIETHDENRTLFLLQSEIRGSKNALESLLRTSFGFSTPAPPWLIGLYFMGTGGGASEHPFVQGVFGKMLEYKANCAWTEEVLREQVKIQRWTYICWVATAICILLTFAVWPSSS